MDLAYLAGLVDGDGCIGFSMCRGRMLPRLMVANTNLEMLQAIQEEFGGDIQAQSRMQDGWKRAYNWRIQNRAAVMLVKALEPWLIAKREAAHLFFAYDAIAPGHGRRWDVERREAAGLLNDQSKWLNFRGTGRSELSPVAVVMMEVEDVE
jgi:hypothetical protein